MSLIFANGRLAFLSLVLLFTVIVSGCSDRFSAAAEYAQTAQAQLETGNLEDARVSALNAIRERDDVAAYFVLLGRIESQMQNLEGAFGAYSRALDLQADNPEILQAIAELGLQVNRLNDAEEAADRILLLYPNAIRAKLVKGFISIERDRFDEAKELAEDILARSPNNEFGSILKARLTALDADLDGAIEIVDTLREETGETLALNITLLEIYRAQSYADGMLEVLPKIVSETGLNSVHQFDLMNTLYKTGRIEQAHAENWQYLISDEADRTGFEKLGSLMIEYDAPALSEEEMSNLIREGSLEARLFLARFYLDQGNLDATERLLSNLWRDGPIEAQALMSRVKIMNGNLDKAEELIVSVLERDGRNPDALLARAKQKIDSGEIDAAIQDLNVVVSDTPEEYQGYIALARANQAKGSLLRANQVFEQGVDFLPQSELLAAEYEAFLRETGERSRIVSLYADLTYAKPSSIPAWEAYARVCDEFKTDCLGTRPASGLVNARTRYVIDLPPGTPRRTGLFAQIRPEQICRSTGGVCTDI